MGPVARCASCARMSVCRCSRCRTRRRRACSRRTARPFSLERYRRWAFHWDQRDAAARHASLQYRRRAQDGLKKPLHPFSRQRRQPQRQRRPSRFERYATSGGGPTGVTVPEGLVSDSERQLQSEAFLKIAAISRPLPNPPAYLQTRPSGQRPIHDSRCLAI